MKENPIPHSHSAGRRFPAKFGPRPRLTLFEGLAVLVVLGGAALMIIPFIWMVSAALKDSTTFYNPDWFSRPLHWENFGQILTRLNFGLYVLNTLKITALATLGTLASCSLTAFALARFKFPGRDALFGFILVSIFLPSQVTLVPTFIIFKNLGIYNSHLPLIIPAFFGNAFGIFLLRQYFLTIPEELSDAAKVDGCGPFRLFYQIYLPLVKPVLITLAILTFQGTWGDIMNPLIYLTDQSLFTMVLGLRLIAKSQFLPQPQLEIAGNLLLILPVMLIYLFAQRYFTQSIQTTGMKG
jgi:ABC-type glycerol-3-phosphate transport system permease component